MAAIEKAEAQLNHLVERRAKAASKAEAEEDLWRASERRHKAAVRRRNVALWYGWHMDQAERHRRALAALIDHHEAQAARLCQEGTR